ncbi:hypothetical protein KCU65_g411, partial [Aureobasidium melanogenum]
MSLTKESLTQWQIPCMNRDHLIGVDGFRALIALTRPKYGLEDSLKQIENLCHNVAHDAPKSGPRFRAYDVIAMLKMRSDIRGRHNWTPRMQDMLGMQDRESDRTPLKHFNQESCQMGQKPESKHLSVSPFKALNAGNDILEGLSKCRKGRNLGNYFCSYISIEKSCFRDLMPPPFLLLLSSHDPSIPPFLTSIISQPAQAPNTSQPHPWKRVRSHLQFAALSEQVPYGQSLCLPNSFALICICTSVALATIISTSFAFCCLAASFSAFLAASSVRSSAISAAERSVLAMMVGRGGTQWWIGLRGVKFGGGGRVSWCRSSLGCSKLKWKCPRTVSLDALSIDLDAVLADWSAFVTFDVTVFAGETALHGSAPEGALCVALHPSWGLQWCHILIGDRVWGIGENCK